MATKLNKRQKELIAKAFDPKPSVKAGTTKEKCPKEFGYMKGGKCVPHKKAKKPKKPSLKKSIKRGTKQQINLMKKGFKEGGKVVI